MSDVGTTRLFENDKVVVWEMVLESGEGVGLHTHYNDYFAHVLEGSTIAVTDKDGVALGEFPVETGSTLWVSVQGDDTVMGDLHFPATHDATNAGSKRYREILVEVK